MAHSVSWCGLQRSVACTATCQTLGSFKVTIILPLFYHYCVHYLLPYFLMVINNGTINGHYSIKDHQGLLLF